MVFDRFPCDLERWHHEGSGFLEASAANHLVRQMTDAMVRFR